MFRRLGRSFHFNSFNPHSEPARKFPLHRRGSESLSFKFTRLSRDRGVTNEPSSLPSNPRLHLPLKSPRFPGSERFFPDPTGGCFCHSPILGGVRGSQGWKGQQTPSEGQTPEDTTHKCGSQKQHSAYLHLENSPVEIPAILLVHYVFHQLSFLCIYHSGAKVYF